LFFLLVYNRYLII